MCSGSLLLFVIQRTTFTQISINSPWTPIFRVKLWISPQISYYAPTIWLYRMGYHDHPKLLATFTWNGTNNFHVLLDAVKLLHTFTDPYMRKSCLSSCYSTGRPQNINSNAMNWDFLWPTHQSFIFSHLICLFRYSTFLVVLVHLPDYLSLLPSCL